MKVISKVCSKQQKNMLKDNLDMKCSVNIQSSQKKK